LRFYHGEKNNTHKFVFNNAQIVLKPMNAEQLEQLKQKQEAKPKEDISALAMLITKEQDKHKIDHGKIKVKEDFDVTIIDKFNKDFKLDVPLVIDFIISNEFNDTIFLFLMCPKVIEE